jgi:hypothetical protein
MLFLFTSYVLIFLAIFLSILGQDINFFRSLGRLVLLAGCVLYLALPALLA